MKKVLIVDDDTIVRITLRSLIDWESFGYEVVADAVNGRQALQYMDVYPVDLVLTDMKMPMLDGLGLMGEIRQRKLTPKILVLSGYDDFKLVREAFRMGAEDYLLKSDLNPGMLEGILKKWQKEEEEDNARQISTSQEHIAQGHQKRSEEGQPGWKNYSHSQQLVDMAMGRYPFNRDMFDGDYAVVQFEIEDYLKHAARFSDNLEEGLVQPVLNFAQQVPRVASKCIVGSLSPSRYLMLYRVTDSRVYRDNLLSTCRQLCNVWKNYLNLPFSVGISEIETSPERFMERVEEAGEQLRLRYLKGKAVICCPWEKEVLGYEAVRETEGRYQRLIQGLVVGDELVMEEERSRLFGGFRQCGLSQAVGQSLCIICSLAWKMEEHQDDIQSLFAQPVNYYEKLKRFQDVRELELWMNNYFRWFLDYQSHKQDRSQEDLMLRAKRFIMDNYSNPELTLGSVAGYVGLNEKYFSSKFTKEEGMTFSNYLTEVRIRKARELMDQTNLKIYEVSQSVGYNSVEHFTRVFKKICKVSPGNYRRT